MLSQITIESHGTKTATDCQRRRTAGFSFSSFSSTAVLSNARILWACMPVQPLASGSSGHHAGGVRSVLAECLRVYHSLSRGKREELRTPEKLTDAEPSPALGCDSAGQPRRAVLIPDAPGEAEQPAGNSADTMSGTGLRSEE